MKKLFFNFSKKLAMLLPCIYFLIKPFTGNEKAAPMLRF